MAKKDKLLEFLNKNKKYLICIVIIILSIISIVFQQIERDNSLIINSQVIEEKEGKIVVYITGQVKNPGIYYLESNARLYNLIDLAGGLLDTADVDKINLAEKLSDSQKINIQAKKEEQNLENEEEVLDDEEINDTSKININTASKEELKSLNGIGDSTAQKIIDYRNNNEFQSIEELMNVSGIGQAKFEAVKEYICVH